MRMAVMRVHKTANYTIMSNYHFKEKEMSLKAKGLLSLMLSLPDDWDYSINGLATLSKDGRDSVMSALQELEKFGYLVRTRVNDERGRFGGYDYDIYEEPQLDLPYTEKPNTDKPKTENPQQLNTNQLNPKENKELNNKLDKIDKSATAPNVLTKMLVDKNYLDSMDPFMNVYNHFTETLVNQYDFEIVRSCIHYFLQRWTGVDENGNEILNKFAYFKTSIENGASKLKRMNENDDPFSYHLLDKIHHNEDITNEEWNYLLKEIPPNPQKENDEELPF